MRRSGILKSISKVYSHPLAPIGISIVGSAVERIAEESGLVDGLTNVGMGALNVLGIGSKKSASETVVEAPASPPPTVPAPETAGHAHDHSHDHAPSAIVGGAGTHVESVGEVEELQVGCGATACAPCAKAAAAAAAALAASAPAPVAVSGNLTKEELENELRVAMAASPALKSWSEKVKAAGFQAFAPFVVASSEPSTEPLEVGSTIFSRPGGKITNVSGRIKIVYEQGCGPFGGQSVDQGIYSAANVQIAKQQLATYLENHPCDATGVHSAPHSAAANQAYKNAQAKIAELQKEKNSWHSKWASEKNSAQKAQYQAQINALEQQIALAQTAQSAIYTNPAVATQLAATPASSMMDVMQQMMQMKMFEQMLAPQTAAPAAYPPGYYPPQAAPYGYPPPQQPYAVDAYGQPAVYVDPNAYGDPQQQYEAANLVNQGIDPNQASDIDPGLMGPSSLTGNDSFDQDLAYSLEGVEGANVEGTAEDYEAAESIFSSDEESPSCIPCGT